MESLLKRATGVKDSGRLIPGHGGMLDRVDALLVVSPMVYLYALWVG
jgi:phosphatidate cytidylyltransferase